MGFRGLIRLVFVGVLLCAGGEGYGQESIIWRRRIARTIELDNVFNNDANKNDSGFLQQVAHALLTKKMGAYSSFGPSFHELLNVADIRMILYPPDDTDWITDNATRKETMSIRKRKNRIDNVTSYRILEDWEYNPLTGIAHMVPVASAPLHKIYDMVTGEYRGQQPLFWLMYDDANKFLVEFRKKHPGSTFSEKLWESHGITKSATQKDSVRNRCNEHIRLLDMTFTEDTLSGWDNYCSRYFVTDMIDTEVVNGKMAAYEFSETDFEHALTKNKAEEILEHALDSFRFIRDEDGSMNVCEMGLRAQPRFCTLEEWEMDMHTGKTDVKIKSIGPIEGTLRSGPFKGSFTFWVRFEDVKHILLQNESHNPGANSFSLRVWNDLLLSGKP